MPTVDDSPIDDSAKDNVCIACHQNPGDDPVYLYIVEGIRGPKIGFVCAKDIDIKDNIWDKDSLRNQLLHIQKRIDKAKNEIIDETYVKLVGKTKAEYESTPAKEAV